MKRQGRRKVQPSDELLRKAWLAGVRYLRSSKYWPADSYEKSHWRPAEVLWTEREKAFLGAMKATWRVLSRGAK